MDSYVEQVLYYLRSQVPEKDYVIRGVFSETVTDQVISRNRDSLILNHIRILQETEDIPARTDEKMAEFYSGSDLKQQCEI